MRPLKFRAWDKGARKWVTDVIVDRLGNHYQYNKCEFWGDDRDIEIVWSTNLKDKNGVEIYEGAVVHYVYQPGPGMYNGDFVGIIKWESTGFSLRPIAGGLSAWLVGVPGAGASEKPNELFEVIGNVYEHPELVKNNEPTT